MTDQAAGLRRSAARLPPRTIQVFSASALCAPRLAQAFQQRGLTVLLVDTEDRLFKASTTRNLFDWRRQLERGQLLTLPMPYGDGWRAAGIRAGEPALAVALRRYDVVLFDAALEGRELAAMPGATFAAAVDVQTSADAQRHAYRLVKTLAQLPGVCGVGLLGNPAGCARVLAASNAFLAPAFARSVHSVAGEDDAFAALAVRMGVEENSLTARYNKGINPNGW